MQLKKLESAITRTERAGINENWEKIERGFSQTASDLNEAHDKADSAKRAAENAVNTANDASKTANGIDGKATEALNKSNQAVSTSNTARDTAQQAKVTTEATAKQINDAIKETGDTNAEVILSRTDTNTGKTYDSLPSRLDDVTVKLESANNHTHFNTTQLYRKPKVSFVVIDDDTRIETYAKAKNYFATKGVKFTFATISDFIDRNLYMSKAMLRDLINEGHELVSHTATHLNLSEITDDASLEYELRRSKEWLKNEMGVETNHIVYPYGGFNKKVVEVASKYYTSGTRFATDLNDLTNHNRVPMSQFALDRIPLGAWGLSDFNTIKTIIDAAIEEKTLCILATHLYANTEEEEAVVAQTFDYIHSLGYEIETFSEAYAYHCNALNAGEYDVKTYRQPLAIGYDGRGAHEETSHNLLTSITYGVEAGSSYTRTRNQSVAEWATGRAERFVTSGGTSNIKFKYDLRASALLKAYDKITLSVYVKNNATHDLQISTNGMTQNTTHTIKAGEQKRLVIRGYRDALNQYFLLLFKSPSASQNVDVTLLDCMVTKGYILNDNSNINFVYEEGSWTPTLNTTGATYTRQFGRYTRIGNRVTIDAYIELSAKGTSNLAPAITGLPFYAADVSLSTGLLNLSIANSNGETLPFIAVAAGNTIELRKSTWAYINLDNINDNSVIRINGTYRV